MPWVDGSSEWVHETMRPAFAITAAPSEVLTPGTHASPSGTYWTSSGKPPGVGIEQRGNRYRSGAERLPEIKNHVATDLHHANGLDRSWGPSAVSTTLEWYFSRSQAPIPADMPPPKGCPRFRCLPAEGVSWCPPGRGTNHAASEAAVWLSQLLPAAALRDGKPSTTTAPHRSQ